MSYHAVVIGAGACGLMCAVQAARRGKRILLMEGNDKIGAKILISGGGRCNFTNLHSSPAQFITQHPRNLARILERWTVEDTRKFFAQFGIRGKEKTLGQLFPEDKKARDVVGAFMQLLNKYKVDLMLHSQVQDIEALASGYRIHFKHPQGNDSLITSKVVMATGGLPIAKLGASDLALRVARKFGMEVHATRPALVPLTITGKDADWFAALSGNTVFCRVWNDRAAFEEQILFTHWGLSGPAILQISSYWRPGELIHIDLLPGQSIRELIRQERARGGKRLLLHLLETHFSRRFAHALGKFLPVNTKVASLSRKDAEATDRLIHNFELKPAGDKGYEKAEVMRGGVSFSELDPHTLEARKAPGMYFGGEAMDVTGWLGGYNFQWAWASGYVISEAL